MFEGNCDSNKIPIQYKGYIFYSFGSFSVKNDRNGVLITFGRFKSQDIACAAVGLLIKHDWDMEAVKNDPICEFGDKFWVFKLINNHLIFDSKFDSFEESVEYLEINSKCNDFHNDILHKKKRKSKFENLNNELGTFDVNIPNIYSKDGSFVVKYKSNGKEYGIFNSMDEAIAAKEILIKNNWKFSNSVEMSFHNSFYWVFKIENNVLFFIDKFESYEDALDCLDLNKSEVNVKNNKQSVFGGFIREIDDDYINDVKNDDYIIENNFKKSILDNIRLKMENKSAPIKSVKTKKTRKSHKKIKYIHKDDDVKSLKEFHRDNIKIHNMDSTDGSNISLIFKNLNSELNIIKFENNTLNDYYSIKCLPDGEIDFSHNLFELNEFKYIWNLLNKFEGNLNRLTYSSSIHYIDDSYYIIKVFDNKVILSGPFSSFYEAEDNVSFLYEFYSKEYSDEGYPHNIEHRGKIFSLSETHNNKNFEFGTFRSIEELKAVIDMFDYHGWNPDIFKTFDMFYYHGMYWIIDYFFYYVKLDGRFNSKEEAINHKFR